MRVWPSTCTQELFEVLPKLVNASHQGTKPTKTALVWRHAHVCFTRYYAWPVFQRHNGCFLCPHKSSVFRIICFPVLFPCWYKRFQLQFVTAGAVKTLMWQSSLVHFSTLLLIGSQRTCTRARLQKGTTFHAKRFACCEHGAQHRGSWRENPPNRINATHRKLQRQDGRHDLLTV